VSDRRAEADLQSEQPLGKAYDARLMRRLWVYIRPYRRWFWGALLCLPLSSAFSLVQPYLIKVGIDHYIGARDPSGLAWIGGAYALAMVGEFSFLYLQYYLTMVVAQRSLARLRVELMEHLQRLPARFFDRNPVGRLVTRMTTDVDVINEMFAAGALTLLMDAVTLAGIVAILVAIEWRLALVTLSLCPLLALAINFFRVAARNNYRLIRDCLARLNAYLQEALNGMVVIQLFARERAGAARFEGLNDAHRRANHAANVYEASLFSLVEAVSSISFALILWYASGRILAGVLAFGTLVAFIEYMQRFFVPVRDFSTKYAVMQSAMSSAERIFQLLDTPATIESPPAPVAVFAGRGRIELDGVWFAYQGEEWVLRDVSFVVEPGEKVALVGPTGSGKTSIIKLLNRTYDVARGRVLVDGVDVRDWDLAALRRRVGVVLQDVFLFSGTVASNLTLGRADIPLAAAMQAAETVHADAFIRRLPGGYDSIVRERGNNLSTGQRQLLAFARALAYQPAVLVLDEATSSVDMETELLIQDALEKLLRGRTALLIAHRLSTIERADRILVVHGGEIRESGTHAELLAERGLYYRLHRLQRAEWREAPRAARLQAVAE
jgi:ATP-binding cassette subfamily B protein